MAFQNKLTPVDDDEDDADADADADNSGDINNHNSDDDDDDRSAASKAPEITTLNLRDEQMELEHIIE